MFSGMGWETVTGCRQYFYIRHIDWAISCSLIILSLGQLADQDVATTLAVMGSSVGMVFSGYLAAVGLVSAASRQRACESEQERARARESEQERERERASKRRSQRASKHQRHAYFRQVAVARSGMAAAFPQTTRVFPQKSPL